ERVEDRRRAVEAITGEETARRYLVEDAQTLLRTLRRWQAAFDARGVLGVSEDDGAAVGDLCRAMTLRDCTLFVRCGGDGGVEARLGDLDLKTSERVGKWRAVEERLGREGWYLGEGSGGEETVCLLSGDRGGGGSS
ncbi:inositol-pentakisphosphate 2-kinase-like, partial [Teratosphaeria destructans]